MTARGTAQAAVLGLLSLIALATTFAAPLPRLAYDPKVKQIQLRDESGKSWAIDARKNLLVQVVSARSMGTRHFGGELFLPESAIPTYSRIPVLVNNPPTDLSAAFASTMSEITVGVGPLPPLIHLFVDYRSGSRGGEPIGRLLRQTVRGNIVGKVSVNWLGLVVHLAVIFTVLSGAQLFFSMLRRARRRKKGLCAQCGYDLRGHVGTGVLNCPECGATTHSSPKPCFAGGF